MAIKGACWIKMCTWDPLGTGVDIHVGIVSVDAVQVENEFMMYSADAAISRADICLAAKNEMINNYNQVFGESDTVVLIPSAI
jgi:hypothetical protein